MFHFDKRKKNCFDNVANGSAIIIFTHSSHISRATKRKAQVVEGECESESQRRDEKRKEKRMK